MKNFSETAWYRALQVVRVLLYLAAILIAWVISAPQRGYTYTNFTSGQIITVPDKPFQLVPFAVFLVVCIILIELVESTVIYMFSGRPVGQTLRDKWQKFYNL